MSNKEEIRLLWDAMGKSIARITFLENSVSALEEPIEKLEPLNETDEVSRGWRYTAEIRAEDIAKLKKQLGEKDAKICELKKQIVDLQEIKVLNTPIIQIGDAETFELLFELHGQLSMILKACEPKK